MEKVKVYIELAGNGYSAYMDKNNLDYGLIGEGRTVDETIADFKSTYEATRSYYHSVNKQFEEADFVFYYDIASFLEEYSKAFSLAGLERITGIRQAQLGHYLHGRSKPTRKTIARIQKGIQAFVEKLSSVQFA